VILVVGEILFDVFEKEKQLGGAPFNFAYHLKNFGFPVRYISRIGNDTHGKEILNILWGTWGHPILVRQRKK